MLFGNTSMTLKILPRLKSKRYLSPWILDGTRLKIAQENRQNAAIPTRRALRERAAIPQAFNKLINLQVISDTTIQMPNKVLKPQVVLCQLLPLMSRAKYIQAGIKLPRPQTPRTAPRNYTSHRFVTVPTNDWVNQGFIKTQMVLLLSVLPKLLTLPRFSTRLPGMLLLPKLTLTFRTPNQQSAVKQPLNSAHRARIKLDSDRIKLTTRSNPNCSRKLRGLLRQRIALKVENRSKGAARSKRQTRSLRLRTMQAHQAVFSWTPNQDVTLVRQLRMSSQLPKEMKARSHLATLSWTLRQSQATTAFNGRSQQSAALLR